MRSVRRRTAGIAAGWALVSLCLLLGAAVSAHAQSKTGTTIGQFLGIEPGARHAAMGNAGTALSEGIESLYFNPGVAGTLQRPAVTFTHSEWFADINFDYAAVAYPLAGFGTVFGSMTSLGSGEIAVRTVDHPLGTGENYTAADICLALGYGRQITSRFAAGIQLNYVHQRIWHSGLSTLTVSAGTMYRLTESGLQMGFSLSHLGTDAKYSGRDLVIQYDENPDQYGDNSALPGVQLTDDYPVPIVFRLGLSYPYKLGEQSRLLFLIDGLHPNDNTESVNLGAEWILRELLSLRAGYQTLFQEDSELGLTFGFGVRLSEGKVQANYAWADHEHLGATHRFTLDLGF
jgi:hypothetical protein